MKRLTPDQIAYNTTRAGYWSAVVVLVVLTCLIQVYFTSRTANPVEIPMLSQDPILQDYEYRNANIQFEQIKKLKKRGMIK